MARIMREIDWTDHRMKNHLRQPVTIPRWLLTAKYFVFILVGLAVLNTNPPSFERAYHVPLTSAWAAALVAVSLLAFVGSLREQWEHGLEKWGTTLIFVLMAVYAFALIWAGINDPDRLAYSAIAILVSLLPYARAVQLWSRHA